jgi:uncharacterized protein (DUF608 family)
MTETESIHMRPETKKFIDETFFQSLSLVNIQLKKLDTEEIDLKQFRNFILEQRVWFAEQVVNHYQDLSLQATWMEEKLLSIGKEVLEIRDND